jgi:hypothetical protein
VATPDATARLDYQSYARVAGLDTSIIRTAVPVDRGVPDPTDSHYNRDADSDGGLFDGGSEDKTGATNRFRQVFWETNVHLIGEPNPLLAIDSTGTIAAKTRNVYVKAYNPVTHTYSGLLAVGDSIPSDHGSSSAT